MNEMRIEKSLNKAISDEKGTMKKGRSTTRPTNRLKKAKCLKPKQFLLMKWDFLNFADVSLSGRPKVHPFFEYQPHNYAHLAAKAALVTAILLQIERI